MISTQRDAEWRVERAFQTNGTRLWFVRRDGAGNVAVAMPTTFILNTFDEGALHQPFEPTLEFSAATTQSLMHEMWSAGIRPTGKGHPSEVIQAKNEHIADLRKALFDGVAGAAV